MYTSSLSVAANITQFSENVVVTSPGFATFSCRASGLPRPSITWSNPNSATLVSGVNGVMITEMDDGDRGIMSILSIISTRPSLAGEYTCTASNGVSGSGDFNETSVELTVYGM